MRYRFPIKASRDAQHLYYWVSANKIDTTNFSKMTIKKKKTVASIISDTEKLKPSHTAYAAGVNF